MSLPTVFVVDDDPAFCQSLRMLLHSVGLRVEDYPSAENFLEAACAERPGCLLLDVRMPGWSGIELQAHINAKRIHMPIIFITGHGDIPMSVKAIKAGAVDFLEKPFKKEVLIERVLQALAEDEQTRQDQIEKAAIITRFERLTPREREVMTLVITGKSNKEIAKELAISYRTVETHRARIMEKMTAKSLPELVALAAVCGIHKPT